MKYSAENMNIALVHDWLTNMAGAERVLLEISLIFPKAPIFTSVYDREAAKPFNNKDVKTSFLQRFLPIRNRRELLIPLTPFAFEQFNLGKFDVVVSSATMAAKGVITKPDTIHICYCHTPSRYLWEPTLDPRADKGKLSGLRKKVAHNMRIWDRVAADRVDFFLANSKYIQKRIKKYYKRESIVVYPPVDINRFEVAPKKEVENYFLFVSRLIGYKKCDLVIKAFNELKLPLKIIGSGPEENSLKKLARDNIEFLGRIGDGEIEKYYAKANASIFAAEEDFGIVPVEAMASGRPVIAFRAGGVLETVIEGKTGEFFDEQSEESLIKAVKKFDHTKYDNRIIREQAEKFSTENFHKNFLKAYNQILNKVSDQT